VAPFYYDNYVQQFQEIQEGTVAAVEESLPYNIHAPRSHLSKRLDRRRMDFVRHPLFLMRFGPGYQREVKERIRRHLPLKERHENRLIRNFADNDDELGWEVLQNAASRFSAREWALRLTQLRWGEAKQRRETAS
jgi:hypothetical protein